MQHIIRHIFKSKHSKIIGALTLLKAFCLLFFSSEYSNTLFQPFVAHFVDNGGNPWNDYFQEQILTDAFPYHALMLWILSIPMIFIKVFGIKSIILSNFIFKLPLLAADLVIFMVLKKLYTSKVNKVLLFYFANPIIWYAIYIHGQLDIIPIAFLTLSLYFLKKENFLWFAMTLGCSLATKFNVLVVVPLLFLYLCKKQPITKTVQYLAVSIGLVILFDLPFLFSDGFRNLVLFNEKQSLLFDSYLAIGELKLLFPVLGIILVYAHFFNQRKVNFILLSFYMVILFTATIFTIYPAPGWFVWLVPFMSIFFITCKNNQKTYWLYATMTISYLLFFVLFYPSEYQDVLFLNKPAHLKILHENFRNISFTLLEASMVVLSYAFYTHGLKSNAIYSSQQNFTIGVGGDSGVGKTTYLQTVSSLFKNKLLHLEGDGEHKWDRGNEKWNTYTHLDPKANDIHKQAEIIQQLKVGKKIRRREYDHNTGKLSELNAISAKDYVAISGLLPFYLPKLRNFLDFKIYLDTEEKLRRHWKIIRDANTRSYTKEQVIQQMDLRVPDFKKFIYPQIKYADLVIRYFSLHEIDLGNENSKINLGLKLTFNANILIENILDELPSKYHWDYNDDLQSQFIELREEPHINYEKIANKNMENLSELISPNAVWQKGYQGFIQLISITIISEMLKDKSKNG